MPYLTSDFMIAVKLESQSTGPENTLVELLGLSGEWVVRAFELRDVIMVFRMSPESHLVLGCPEMASS